MLRIQDVSLKTNKLKRETTPGLPVLRWLISPYVNDIHYRLSSCATNFCYFFQENF